MADNFFAQFHEQPVAAAPSGNVNYFSQFHDDAQPGADRPRVIIHTAPQKPDAGVADAAGRGLGQGITANFGDEIQALSEVGGGTKGDQRPQSIGDTFDAWQGSGVEHFVGGLIKYLAGNPEARKKYDEAVDREREANKAAEKNHPIANTLGNVAGVVATLPLGGEASQGAGVVTRALAAAKQGAIYGGVAGAGEGEGATDTVTKAAGGTALGGILGGVGAPIVEGGATLVRAAARPAINAVRGAFNPEAEAARRYLTALEHDRKADPTAISRMTPAEYAGNPDALLMDLGGGMVKRLADSANITSPAGGLKMKQAIDQRFEGQAPRFSDWFRSNFNYPDAYGQSQALDQVAKNVNRPAYMKAYAQGDRQIMSPELERLMSSPKVVEAMRAASVSGKDRAVTEGFGAFNPGVTVENGLVKFRSGKNGAPTYPNLQFWDQTRRELSDAAKRAERSGANEEATVYGNLAKQMNAELDREVPSYQQARQGAAAFFGADNALEAGRAFVGNSKISLSEASAQLAKMTPAERRLFTDGFVSDYVDKVINRTGDRRDVLQKIANSPEARAKLELVLGKDKVSELEAKIRVEGIFDDVRKAVQGNSITAKRLYDLGLAGGAGLGAHGTYDMDPKEMATGALIGALASGGKRINVNVATKLAEMLISRDPAVVQKGFKVLSGNSRLMDALRDADTKIGRVISSQAPVVPVLQAAGVSRADDKPNVPRPPGQ